jgi:hypothetical protein
MIQQQNPMKTNNDKDTPTLGSRGANVIKAFSNWIVFTVTAVYVLREFFLLLGALFVAGSNDTGLEISGLIALGLSPIAAVVLAFRHRRIAAVCLLSGAVLFIIGMIDGERYLARKFSRPIRSDEITMLVELTALPICLGIYYGSH